MHTALARPSFRRMPITLATGFEAPLVVLLILVLAILRGVVMLPDGFDGSGGLGVSIGVLLTVWALAFALRSFQPGSRPVAAIEATTLFLGISLASSLAAAAGAVGGGAYIDPWLVAADQALFPFYDWKAVALAFPDYQMFYRVSALIYTSLNWQPALFIILVMGFGKIADQFEFITAWGFGLLLCILPFHWLPVRSPYIHYGITQADLPGNMVALPWTFYPVLEGLRNGDITAINAICLTGMVTVPSFHACAATLLAWAYWRMRWLRWPFLGLNIGMALAAVPIGGHYIIDIFIGIGCGLIAIAGTIALRKQRELLTARSACD